MIRCTECGASHEDGALFCNECGGFLLADPEQEAVVLPFSEFVNLASPPALGEDVLSPKVRITYKIILIIPDSRHRLQHNIENEAKIGRASSDLMPEIDLTNDNGAEKGVSRLHAKIQVVQDGLVLVDLESTNGTFLNNYRLPPHQPHLLQSGDEIRFGDLLAHFFIFESSDN